MMHTQFHYRNRTDAGRRLFRRLTKYANRNDVIVLGLPRGGVPVAFEVAHALAVPLDVFVVRKVGLPGHAELAMGAVSSGGISVINSDIVYIAGVSHDQFLAASTRELQEIDRRER